jgi:hypothetical protein
MSTLKLSSASLKALEIISPGRRTVDCLRDSVPTAKSSDLPGLEKIVLHRVTLLNTNVVDSALQSVGVILKQGLAQDDYTLLE